jgi:hypothetical protein
MSLGRVSHSHVSILHASVIHKHRTASTVANCQCMPIDLIESIKTNMLHII